MFKLCQLSLVTPLKGGLWAPGKKILACERADCIYFERDRGAMSDALCTCDFDCLFLVIHKCIRWYLAESLLAGVQSTMHVRVFRSDKADHLHIEVVVVQRAFFILGS